MRHLTPSSAQMWIACGLAPLICPITLAALWVCIAVVSDYTGGAYNPAAVVVVPVLAMTVGVVASYLAAVLIGMPIAFMLRRFNALNFLTIHAAALVWACIASWASMFLVGGDGSPSGHRLSFFGQTVLLIGVPILLSAFGFWAVLRFPEGRRTTRGFDVISQHPSVPDVPVKAIRMVDGRIRVRPTKPVAFGDYKYIYRTASFARWDDQSDELFSVLPQPTPTAEFTVLVHAVESEYGDRLLITDATTFTAKSGAEVEALRLSPRASGRIGR